MPIDLLHEFLVLAVPAGSAFLAGGVNAIAGGGSLLTFPALLGAGLTGIEANATSTVALVPASIAAWWQYRRFAPPSRRDLAVLVVPSVLGGLAGAGALLRFGESVFRALAPWLVLGATLLFGFHEVLQRTSRQLADRAHRASDDRIPESGAVRWLLPLFQFGVALYGGYFGAGIGILMLAALSLSGMRDIHRMNGLKNAAGAVINGLAAGLFVVRGVVHWPHAVVMVPLSILGASAGTRLAGRIGRDRVRTVVLAIGLTLTLLLLLRR